ncbi:MAG TPA: hypothetical protein VGW77_03175 [Candidatus Binatia bacterium]|nr:hypothetical protein [Candidatus Binatia bacterium]
MPSTIVLPAKANVSLSDVYDSTYGPTGLPLITGPITIQGNGGRVRGQWNAFRLLAVSNSGDLTLQNVTLTNGAGLFNNGILTLDNSTISGNTAFRGGVVSNRGSLTIQNSTISKNPDGIGGGVSNGGLVYIGYSTIPQNPFKSGPFCFYYYNYTFMPHTGGVYCNYYLYSGVLTITNSTISKNSRGGICNYSGTVTINNGNISDNKGSLGGGAFNHGGSFDYYGKSIPAGDFSIANSTISKNSGGVGGGVFNKGVLTIENSTISGNKASDDGGGIFNASNYNNAPAGDLSLLDTTISENRAKDSGGGLFNEGSLNVTNSTISGNKAHIGPDVFP